MRRTALLILWCAPLTGFATAAEPDRAPKADRDFVLAATQAGQQEVHDAALAAKSSRMEPVRHIARLLEQDHRSSNAKLMALAHAKALSLPVIAASPSPTPSFSDAEYVAGQIQAHEDAIALFTSEAERGVDQDFRAFARQLLPVLKSRLQTLRALQTP
jgi:putative membrane protein